MARLVGSIRTDKAIGIRTALHVGKINHPVFGSIGRIQGLKIITRNQIGFTSTSFTIAKAVGPKGSNQQISVAIPIHITG